MMLVLVCREGIVMVIVFRWMDSIAAVVRMIHVGRVVLEVEVVVESY